MKGPTCSQHSGIARTSPPPRPPSALPLSLRCFLRHKQNSRLTSRSLFSRHDPENQEVPSPTSCALAMGWAANSGRSRVCPPPIQSALSLGFQTVNAKWPYCQNMPSGGGTPDAQTVWFGASGIFSSAGGWVEGSGFAPLPQGQTCFKHAGGGGLGSDGLFHSLWTCFYS